MMKKQNENKIYQYLSGLICKFFNDRTIQAGERFQIKFERNAEVVGLYEALKQNRHETFSYKNYTTYSLKINDIDLIIAANINGIKEDFLTGLRNRIAENEGIFKRCAIFFIHNTNLDSLLNGSESLTKEGMPLYISNIKTHIKKDLNSSNVRLSKDNKVLLNFLLNQKVNEYFVKNRSLFDFEPFLNILSQGEIHSNQYIELNIFTDRGLYTTTTKNEKEKRLNQNIQWYKEIQNAHDYDDWNSLEKQFSETDLKKIKKTEWKQLDYVDLQEWANEKKSAEGIIYEKIEPANNKDINIELFDKSDGDSPAKQRRRHVLIFNPDLHNTFELKIIFNKRPSEKGVKKNKYFNDNQIRIERTAIIVTFSIKKNDQITVKQFQYQDFQNKNKFLFNFAVVPVNSYFLTNIQTVYRVNIRKKAISIEADDSIIFNQGMTERKEEPLTHSQTYIIEKQKKLIINLENFNYDEHDEDISFKLSYDKHIIPFILKLDSVKPDYIDGFEVWQNKIQHKTSFKYSITKNQKGNDIISLDFNTNRYYLKGDFRLNIKHEKEIINNIGGFYWFEDKTFNLRKKDLILNNEIAAAYERIISYYKEQKQIPSTLYLKNELKELYKNFLTLFIDKIENLAENKTPAKDVKELSKIGLIKSDFGENMFKMTPLHPLNMAYQLFIYENIDEENISSDVLRCLTPTNLIPYMYNEKRQLYSPYGQTHSHEWLYYSNAGLTKQPVSKIFVPDLIVKKINDFMKYFPNLFIKKNKIPIRINLINMGDCQEALKGVFKFYLNNLIKNNNNVDNISPMEIHIYSNSNQTTKFEEISLLTNPDLIEQEFGINLTSKKYKEYTAKDLLNIFYSKIHFYCKQLSSNNHSYQYAHISFYQFSTNEIDVDKNFINNVPTGISLNGLLADVPSIYEQGAYRTGFGIKGIKEKDIKENLLLKLVTKYNALLCVSETDSLYKKDEAFATVINSSVKANLDSLYEESHWVTFIDPKVDLSFFQDSKDLIIIHYSDQYNNASGYDAITVTRKSEHYQNILLQHLKGNRLSKHLEDIEISGNIADTIKKLINIYNTLNGEWLLELTSRSNKRFSNEENISKLAAVKSMLAILYHPNICWIPISLEEILRISGGVGLKQSEGLFSVKNLGAKDSHCDDLLFIGIECFNKTIKMYLYPVEVKIGKIHNSVLLKAIKQVTNTSKLLKQYLSSDNTFRNTFYRNFFAKIALISAEKMVLYNIWPEFSKQWEKIKDFRNDLMNDNFSISHNLDIHIGQNAIVLFDELRIDRSIECQDNKYIIKLLKYDSIKFLVEEIDQIKEMFHSGNTTIKSELFLATQYKVTASDNQTSNLQINENRLTDNNVKPKKTILTKNPMKIHFGYDLNNSKPIHWYPTSTDKVMHINTGIIGTMGTGKTQFTKSMVMQLFQSSEFNVNQTKLGILIFDYKGDYIKDDFVKATNARIFDLYHLPYNPLSINVSSRPKPLLPLHIAETLQQTISNAFNLGNIQKYTLNDLILNAYNRVGIDKNNKKTWNRTAPTIADMCEAYLEDTKTPKDSLYAALEKLYKFEIFEPDSKKAKSLFDIIDGVTVINLSGYSIDIQNLVVAITLDLFYYQMQKQGHSSIQSNYRELTKILLVDEADNFLSQNFKSIKKILKEGREFGVGTILSTQFLDHFSTSDNEYSKYILTWIVHRVNDIKLKELDSLFVIQDKEMKTNIMNKIKELEKHNSIVNLAGSKPILMKDRAFWEIIREMQ